MSQNYQLAQYLSTGLSISKRAADADMGIQSLSKRVADLREKGMEIVTDYRVNPVTEKKYATYRLNPNADEKQTQRVMDQIKERMKKYRKKND